MRDGLPLAAASRACLGLQTLHLADEGSRVGLGAAQLGRHELALSIQHLKCTWCSG